MNIDRKVKRAKIHIFDAFLYIYIYIRVYIYIYIYSRMV